MTKENMVPTETEPTAFGDMPATHPTHPTPAHDGASTAIKTLQMLGYTFHGGELWKPPLGTARDADHGQGIVTDKQRDRALDTLLEHSFWPPELRTSTSHARKQDDSDGSNDEGHYLRLWIGADGDVFIMPRYDPNEALRFRGPFGGSRSDRVYRALLVLSEAIRRDNADRPQPAPP